MHFSGFGGLWGMLAVGIFGKKDNLENLSRYSGLLHGGGPYLLGVQALACLALSVWASMLTFLLIRVLTRTLTEITPPSLLQGINFVIPFRMTEAEELIGADYAEHNIHHPGVGVTRAVSVIGRRDPAVDLGLTRVGNNKGHSEYLEKIYSAKLAAVLAERNGENVGRWRRTKKKNAVADMKRERY